MPEIEIRPLLPVDIPTLVALEHDYVSDYVWQMTLDEEEEGQIDVKFRRVRLPRSVKMDYPRSPHTLTTDWARRAGVLVAVLAGEAIGYASVALDIAPLTTWITDLAVTRRMRMQGVGTALILACLEWARQHGSYRLVLEMQPKNHPAVSLARKLGFDFCGYNDRYYANHDIALFFAKVL